MSSCLRAVVRHVQRRDLRLEGRSRRALRLRISGYVSFGNWKLLSVRMVRAFGVVYMAGPNKGSNFGVVVTSKGEDVKLFGGDDGGNVFEAKRPGCKFSVNQRLATYFYKGDPVRFKRLVEAFPPVAKQVPPVIMAFTVRIRLTNNIYRGMQFIDWERLTGLQ